MIVIIRKDEKLQESEIIKLLKRNYGSSLFYFVICVNNHLHFKTDTSLVPIRNGINHW